MIRVLIHSPISNNCEEFWESIRNIDTSGFEVDFYFTYTNIVPLRTDDKGNYNVSDLKKNLTYKMEKARKMVLEGGYDYLLNFEDDHIIPPNVLHELIKWKKDAVSGVYRLRPSKYSSTPIAATRYDTRKWVTKEDLEETDLLRIDLMAWGCMLLSRKALEKCSFEDVLDGQYKMRLEQAGIERWLATKVHVGHIDREGSVIWP